MYPRDFVGAPTVSSCLHFLCYKILSTKFVCFLLVVSLLKATFFKNTSKFLKPIRLLRNACLTTIFLTDFTSISIFLKFCNSYSENIVKASSDLFKQCILIVPRPEKISVPRSIGGPLIGLVSTLHRLPWSFRIPHVLKSWYCHGPSA